MPRRLPRCTGTALPQPLWAGDSPRRMYVQPFSAVNNLELANGQCAAG